MTIDAKLYSIFANVAYKSDTINPLTGKTEIEETLTSVLATNGITDSWQVLEVDGKKVTSKLDGFQAVAYGLDSNGDGTYEQVVIAYRGSQPPTVKAPVEMIKDWLINDGQILFDITPAQFSDAQAFYLAVFKAYGSSSNGDNISITGHSLGGTLAQLIGVENTVKAYTYNAPGMLDLVSKLMN